MFMTDSWKEYNNEINGLEINDAVKITSSNWESFWVEVSVIENNGKIIGKIINDLIRQHEYKVFDYIEFEFKHIKQVNKAINRTMPNEEQMSYFKDKIREFKQRNGRNPTLEEFSRYVNINIIPTNE